MFGDYFSDFFYGYGPLEPPRVDVENAIRAVLQQSRKFAAISSSRAISGGIGNSGISVDELVYLVFVLNVGHN